jgi:hypothetical protein
MASRGGPALGDLNIGAVAAALGPVGALSVGGVVPVMYAGLHYLKGSRLRGYATSSGSSAVPDGKHEHVTAA